MRTFHRDRDALHGFTVLAETAGISYVGRCDDLRDGRLILLDVAACAGDAAARDAFRRQARARGVWPEQARIVLPLAQVLDLRPLGAPAPATGAALEAPRPEPDEGPHW